MEHALANLDDPDAVRSSFGSRSACPRAARNELDKKGQPCTAYDAVFNADVVKQAMAHRKLKVFLVELCLQWIAQKYESSTPSTSCRTGDTSVTAPPKPQCIRVDRKSMIEEIDEPDEEPSGSGCASPGAARSRCGKRRRRREIDGEGGDKVRKNRRAEENRGVVVVRTRRCPSATSGDAFAAFRRSTACPR